MMLYDEILIEVSNPVIICDVNHQILNANSSAQKLLGLSLELLQKMSIGALFENISIPTFDQSSTSNGIRILDRKHEDNGNLILHIRMHWIKKGKKDLLIVNFSELSHLNEAINQVVLSEERLRYVMEASLDGYYDWNIATGDIYYSERWFEILGIRKRNDASELSHINARVHSDDLPGLEHELNKILSGEEIFFTCEYRLKHENGNYLYVKNHGQIILHDKSGKPYRMVGIISDVTSEYIRNSEIKNYSEKLEQMVAERTFELANKTENLLDNQTALTYLLEDVNESRDELMVLNNKLEQENILRQRVEEQMQIYSDRLEETNRELESFSYSVSHDLRAPLRSIDGFSQALIEDFQHDLPQQAAEYLDRIRKSTQRMGGLIDDLLKLSRLNRAPMKSVHFNLSEAAHLIMEELINYQKDRAYQLEIEDDLFCEGDNYLLHFMLQNLLNNAWKFSSRENPAIIKFYKLKGGQHEQQEISDVPVFCIEDNGVGFDMRYVDKIFGAFQRVHSEKEFVGSGIGLATVQRIIQRHHGKIWAKSEKGVGTKFYFQLP